jgi:hypothetical protein
MFRGYIMIQYIRHRNEQYLLYVDILPSYSIVRIVPAIKFLDSHERAYKHTAINESVHVITSVYMHVLFVYMSKILANLVSKFAEMY